LTLLPGTGKREDRQNASRDCRTRNIVRLSEMN
jgi:hypothetical protein